MALEVPVKAADPAKARKRAKTVLPESTPATPAVLSTSIKRAGDSAAPAANDDRKPTETAKRSAIVTARLVPEEDHGTTSYGARDARRP